MLVVGLLACIVPAKRALRMHRRRPRTNLTLLTQDLMNEGDRN